MKHQYKKFSKNNFDRTPPKTIDIKIEEVSPKLLGKTLSIKGIVESINQTGGPTLFSVSDGTGLLVLKGFEGPGIRAFPEINEGDAINSLIKLNEYKDDFEGEIVKFFKLSEDKSKEVFNFIKNIQRERAKPKEINFLIKSQILEKLKQHFIKAATEIRLAIFQNRPIIIRHHNDADGYSSGYSLERAILPLIEKQHLSSKAAWEFYTRAPCSAPFYEIDDSIRDTAKSLSNVAKFSNKMPLVIIADNGSSPEDLMAIKQGKVHGMDFIVVDHHYFDEDVISNEVLVHINPFLVGEDGSHFSAGMLCTELARFINDIKGIEQIPAMAGIADRIDIGNPQAVDAYLEIAKKYGYSKELLSDIATVIDFVSSKIRFMEVREYIEVLFGEPKDKQKELVSLLSPYIKKLELKGLEISKNNSKIEKIGKVSLQILDIENTFPGFGFYPKPGKCVGMLHDFVKEQKKIDSLVTIFSPRFN